MKYLKLCINCGELVNFNSYFYAYICKKCNYREQLKREKFKTKGVCNEKVS